MYLRRALGSLLMWFGAVVAIAALVPYGYLRLRVYQTQAEYEEDMKPGWVKVRVPLDVNRSNPHDRYRPYQPKAATSVETLVPAPADIGEWYGVRTAANNYCPLLISVAGVGGALLTLGFGLRLLAWRIERRQEESIVEAEIIDADELQAPATTIPTGILVDDVDSANEERSELLVRRGLGLCLLCSFSVLFAVFETIIINQAFASRSLAIGASLCLVGVIVILGIPGALLPPEGDRARFLSWCALATSVFGILFLLLLKGSVESQSQSSAALSKQLAFTPTLIFLVVQLVVVVLHLPSGREGS